MVIANQDQRRVIPFVTGVRSQPLEQLVDGKLIAGNKRPSRRHVEFFRVTLQAIWGIGEWIDADGNELDITSHTFTQLFLRLAESRS